MKTFIKSIAIVSALFLISCGGSDDGGDSGNPPPIVKDPEATTLVFPLKNSECNEGTVISESSSKVTFEWNTSLNTTKYTLVLKDLSTNAVTEVNTTKTTETVTIKRGTSYSWNVISKSSESTKTATSEIWNFYNAGNPVSYYAPFPANIVSPTMGSLTSSEVTLKWNGSDLDNDIESYDVYLDNNATPTTLYKTTTETTVSNIVLNTNVVYYWFVVTKDKQGNSSKSVIYDFRTQ